MSEVFFYNKYLYYIKDNILNIKYHFISSFNNSTINFYPTLEFIIPNKFFNNNINKTILEKLIFNLGLVESISYWKATCPQNYLIQCGSLSNEQIEWWKDLFFYGLGEFRYKNNIKSNLQSFININSYISYDNKSEISDCNNLIYNFDKIIIPVGGGKDSNITLEELKINHTIIPFAINPNSTIQNCISAAGFNENNIIIVNRHLDKTLLQLNDKGALNGHTPFSALVAFATLIAAELTNTQLIALSNEASANESTVVSQNKDIINHQYSKSFYFEQKFREYYSKYISNKYNYFSYLRPFSELKIAEKFSHYKQYHKIFRSCNVGSKQGNIWCCNCPKCLFVFLILLPFLSLKELIDIFGQNLLENNNLQDTLFQLTGLATTKPFECVGTVSETRTAIAKYLTINPPNGILLPYMHKTSDKQLKNDLDNFNKILNSYNNNNFVPFEI